MPLMRVDKDEGIQQDKEEEIEDEMPETSL